MRTARRYLASEIYRSSAVVLVALLGLFTFFNLIDELDKLSSSFTLIQLLYLQALSLPTQLYELLPIALLIGAVLALAGLAQRNELVVLRVSGVSGLQLIFLLWSITIPLMVGAYVLSEYITPSTEIQVSESSMRLLGRSGGGRLDSGYWFKENDEQGNMRIINIGRLVDKNNVTDIAVYDFNPKQELLQYIEAPSGRFNNQTLVLEKVTQSQLHPELLTALENATVQKHPLIELQHLSTLSLNTNLNAERLLARVLTPERMAITDLLDYIDYLDANHLQTERQTVALWRKIAYPFTLLVMMTIAAPIGFMQTRRGGVGSKMFLGILIGVGYFMANQLALNLGMLSHWQPWVTALMPSLLALFCALCALLFVENHQRWRRRKEL